MNINISRLNEIYTIELTLLYTKLVHFKLQLSITKWLFNDISTSTEKIKVTKFIVKTTKTSDAGSTEKSKIFSMEIP